MNFNGKTPGLFILSTKAQVNLIKLAYNAARIHGQAITQTPFIECHGTRTQEGDVIKTTAIRTVFRSKNRTLIGSVTI